MTESPESPAARTRRFKPAPVRARHDGWTPERQLAFIDALAECACVAEACASVGVSRQAAYALRTRPEAREFRMAWDAAIDLAIRRLGDACLSRALHGEPIPHFYQGEQIGEHRRYDNRLAMFLLRYRDPLRYAATHDQMVYRGHPEAAGLGFARARNRLLDEAHGAEIADPGEGGGPAYAAEPVAVARSRAKAEAEALDMAGIPETMSLRHRRHFARQRARQHEEDPQQRGADARDAPASEAFPAAVTREDDPGPDGASTLSTSAPRVASVRSFAPDPRAASPMPGMRRPPPARGA